MYCSLNVPELTNLGKDGLILASKFEMKTIIKKVTPTQRMILNYHGWHLDKILRFK